VTKKTPATGDSNMPYEFAMLALAMSGLAVYVNRKNRKSQ
ncbi:LPXTG-motif cell wall anchor domain-containing protein, partial [Peptostreptococcaceae bacterium pGA-8]